MYGVIYILVVVIFCWTCASAALGVKCLFVLYYCVSRSESVAEKKAINWLDDENAQCHFFFKVFLRKTWRKVCKKLPMGIPASSITNRYRYYKGPFDAFDWCWCWSDAMICYEKFGVLKLLSLYVLPTKNFSVGEMSDSANHRTFEMLWNNISTF